MSCRCDCHGDIDCHSDGYVQEASARLRERHVIERALYDAQLTSYPYATAEAERLRRAFKDRGYKVALDL